jgi:hypothetical protein
MYLFFSLLPTLYVETQRVKNVDFFEKNFCARCDFRVLKWFFRFVMAKNWLIF